MSDQKRIFVSHASADQKLVGEFVDRLLFVGLGLTPNDVFYSSGAGTGVEDGEDLLATVRSRVSADGLVIAIISPTFQTRPVCLAELGAAWSRAGGLLPFMVPGMDRDELEGVLGTISIHGLDKKNRLDAIRDRIEKIYPDRSLNSTTVWNEAKDKWLADVDRLSAELPRPTIVTAEEHDSVLGKLDGTRRQLAEALERQATLERQVDGYLNAGISEEQLQALLPEDESERFETLHARAAAACRKLDSIVVDTLYYTIAQGSMPMPAWGEDRERHLDAQKAISDGDLVDRDEYLALNDDIDDNVNAETAVRALQEMLEYGSDPFQTWFRQEYGAKADLRIRRVWDRLF